MSIKIIELLFMGLYCYINLHEIFYDKYLNVLVPLNLMTMNLNISKLM